MRYEHYRYTWGALVVDLHKSIVGTSVGLPDRRAAEISAFNRCEYLGGTQCELKFSYDSCGAVAEPFIKTDDASMLITAQAATKYEVIRDAQRTCTEANKVDECRLVYAECNYPRRVY